MTRSKGLSRSSMPWWNLPKVVRKKSLGKEPKAEHR